MPYVHVQLMAGRDENQLRDMVGAITDAMEKTVAAQRESVQVIVEEVAPNRWAAAGKLVSDR